MYFRLFPSESCQEKKQQSQRASLKSTEGRDQGVSMEGTGAQQRGRDIQWPATVGSWYQASIWSNEQKWWELPGTQQKQAPPGHKEVRDKWKKASRMRKQRVPSHCLYLHPFSPGILSAHLPKLIHQNPQFMGVYIVCFTFLTKIMTLQKLDYWLQEPSLKSGWNFHCTDLLRWQYYYYKKISSDKFLAKTFLFLSLLQWKFIWIFLFEKGVEYDTVLNGHCLD